LAGPKIEQRLAAVLAADVAGYSRLMQGDAHATVVDLDACRDVFRARVDAAGGRVVDTAGDSVLAVFELATKAVQAAMAIQEELAERNEPIPTARRMQFRIGVHLGEVLHKADGTVYGDGVNIAARLESLAEAGGICVSANVHDISASKVNASFAFFGEHRIKNIERPVRAWKIVGGRSEGAAAAAKPTPERDRPSIVVLPFDNMSGDAEQSYFSDGITEDIITDLSKVPGLFVIARNSAFVYKGKAHNLPDVARALGVRYVLEGSVRKAGPRIRITTQLIDGTTGGHVWAERYDRELADIFAVQDEVTEAIVRQLSLRLGSEVGGQAVRHHGTRNIEAWDLFLRARESFWTLTPGSVHKAVETLREAIMLDPKFAAAHALLGHARSNQHVNRWGDDHENGLAECFAEAEAAIALDPAEAHGHLTLALALQYDGRPDEALESAERALALDPSGQSHGITGSIMLALGRGEDAVRHFDAAMRLDPHHPNVMLHLCARGHYMLGDYERARALLEQRLAITVDTDSTPFLLASCLGRLGEPEAAAKAWRHVFAVSPDFSIATRRQTTIHRDKRHFEDIVDGLRMAGIDPDVKP